jgi:hypothetical protein
VGGVSSRWIAERDTQDLKEEETMIRIVMTGLITLLLDDYNAPKDIQAIMAGHGDHQSVLTLNVGDIVLDDDTPDADYLVQGPLPSEQFALYFLNGQDKNVSFIVDPKETDQLSITKDCKDTLVDLQEQTKLPVNGASGALPQLSIKRGSITCEDKHTASDYWQFCRFGMGDAPMVNTCKMTTTDTFSSRIIWEAKGVTAIKVGNKKIRVRQNGATVNIGLSNEPNEMKTRHVGVLRHFEAVYRDILGAPEGDWLLPYNSSLEGAAPIKNSKGKPGHKKPHATPAQLYPDANKKLTAPDRCPGGIAYFKK